MMDFRDWALPIDPDKGGRRAGQVLTASAEPVSPELYESLVDQDVANGDTVIVERLNDGVNDHLKSGATEWNAQFLFPHAVEVLSHLLTTTSDHPVKVLSTGHGMGLECVHMRAIAQRAGKEITVDSVGLTPYPQRLALIADYHTLVSMVEQYRDRTGDPEAVIAKTGDVAPLPLNLLSKLQNAGYPVFRRVSRIARKEYVGSITNAAIPGDTGYDLLYDRYGGLFLLMRRDPQAILSKALGLLCPQGVMLCMNVRPSEWKETAGVVPEGFIVLISVKGEMLAVHRDNRLSRTIIRLLGTAPEALAMGEIRRVQDLEGLLAQLTRGAPDPT